MGFLCHDDWDIIFTFTFCQGLNFNCFKFSVKTGVLIKQLEKMLLCLWPLPALQDFLKAVISFRADRALSWFGLMIMFCESSVNPKYSSVKLDSRTDFCGVNCKPQILEQISGSSHCLCTHLFCSALKVDIIDVTEACMASFTQVGKNWLQ